jgi:DNA-binding protein YbaB
LEIICLYQGASSINKLHFAVIISTQPNKKNNNEVSELIVSAHNDCNEKVVEKMKKIVPEFKSMNSVFETLDK